jgi:hypothetical protein
MSEPGRARGADAVGGAEEDEVVALPVVATDITEGCLPELRLTLQIIDAQNDRAGGLENRRARLRLVERHGTQMSDLILYVDRSEVREGALDALKPAVRELVDFVEANEPRLIAYNVYFSEGEDGTKMTVVSVHPDSASLEYHMAVAGPLFRRFVELVTLSSIHIYGEPSEKVLQQSHEKARLLGRGAVVVEPLFAGFTRLVPSGAGEKGVPRR